ncbi:hypothetical protein [Streptomyces sp. NPDC096012]|uniref:hypothetical protein n=1 Tax=Streptomyces sp. NPDC096012 TaxID=3155684 RepID=UPI00336A21E1
MFFEPQEHEVEIASAQDMIGEGARSAIDEQETGAHDFSPERTERTRPLKWICSSDEHGGATGMLNVRAGGSLAWAEAVTGNRAQVALDEALGEAVGVERLAVSGDREVGEEIPIERECRNGSFFRKPKVRRGVRRSAVGARRSALGARRDATHVQLRVALAHCPEVSNLEW